jgi:adenosylmethionine-8-amino-7-oxononanoate aminotransferase
MEPDGYHLWHPYTPIDSLLKQLGLGPVTITGGDGVYLHNQKGDRYINGSSSLWNVAIGLGREELAEVAAQQMRELAYASCYGQTHPQAVKLAARLVEITGGHYDQVYLGSSGSEAVEAALKIARQFWRQSTDAREKGKFKVVALRGGYHGAGFGPISATPDANDATNYGPLLEGFETIEPPYCYRCPYGKSGYPECGLACAEALRDKIAEQKPETVAAFLMEPVMGVLGAVAPPAEYYQRVGEICREANVLLMVDEVATGFGRTGKLFESLDWTLRPDVLILGKAISSGYLPLSATLTTAAVGERFRKPGQQLDHGTTCSGHPVCCAVSLANIEIILREKLPEKAAASGQKLKEGLESLLQDSPIVGEVRGRGLFLGIELVKDRATRERLPSLESARHVTDLAELGLLLARTENVLVLAPPLILSDEVVGELLEILQRGLAAGWSATIGRRVRAVKGKARDLLDRQRGR